MNSFILGKCTRLPNETSIDTSAANRASTATPNSLRSRPEGGGGAKETHGRSLGEWGMHPSGCLWTGIQPLGGQVTLSKSSARTGDWSSSKPSFPSPNCNHTLLPAHQPLLRVVSVCTGRYMVWHLVCRYLPSPTTARALRIKLKLAPRRWPQVTGCHFRPARTSPEFRVVMSFLTRVGVCQPRDSRPSTPREREQGMAFQRNLSEIPFLSIISFEKEAERGRISVRRFLNCWR